MTKPSAAKKKSSTAPTERPEWLTNLLRAASWHRRKIAAGCAFIAVLAALATITHPDVESVEVITAATTLSPGTQLTSSDVRTTRVPKSLLPEEAISDAEQILGRTTVSGVTAGTILTTADLLIDSATGATAGEQLVPIRISDTGIAKLLRVGDRITVVASSFDGQQSVLASGVRVAALPQQEQSNSPVHETGELVVVAADSTTAAKLAGAGTQMQLGVVLG